MTRYPSAWQARKWATLASIVVTLGLVGVLWWMFGGCESEPPADKGKAGGPDVASRLAALEAMKDENVREVSAQVAWFFAQHGRLPADLDEVARTVRVAGWPPVPRTDARGGPLACRAAGGDGFEVVLLGADRLPGTADDVAVPVKIPPNLPTNMTPDVFRAWWETEHYRQALGSLGEDLRSLRPGPGGQEP